MRRFLVVTLVFFLATGIMVSCIRPVAAAVLLYENWQSGKVDLSRWRITKDYPGMTVVNTPRRLNSSSDKAIRFELAYDSWNKCPAGAGTQYGLEANWFNCHDPAAEIRVAQSGINTLSWNNTYWYGWSVYFPTANFTDTNMVFAQWHDIGASGSGPPMAFETHASSGKVRVIFRWDAGSGRQSKSIQLFTPQAGVWYDFVVNAKVAPNNSGFAKIWVHSNGQQITTATHNGPMGNINGEPASFLKFGIYTGSWRHTPNPGVVKRVVIDEIRIGNASSSFNEVNPTQGGSGPQPTTPPTVQPTVKPTTQPTAVPQPTVNPQTNLLLNSGFENGTNEWRFNTNGAATFTVESPGFSSSKAGVVKIQQVGTTQLYQSGLRIESGKTYTLRFTAKANRNRGIRVDLLQHVDSFTNYVVSASTSFTLDIILYRNI